MEADVPLGGSDGGSVDVGTDDGGRTDAPIDAPIRVGTCDGLAAPGEWQDITPPEVTLEPPYTGALTVLPHPTEAGTLYVLTSGSGVFRSTDCGAHWTRVNTGRNADQIDAGLAWSAVIDPVAPDTIYTLTGYGPPGVWKSTDGGVNWDQIVPESLEVPGFTARVAMDPVDHLHLMINFHDDCAPPHTPVCFAETMDGGATWRVLDFPTALADAWGEGTSIYPLDATHWIYQRDDLFYTADAGATWTLVTPGGAFGAGYIQGPFFRTPDGAYHFGSTYGVLRSPDGATWTRIEDSGHALIGLTGDGTRLIAVEGFQPPGDTDEIVFSATYVDPANWSPYSTRGLRLPLASGASGIEADPIHHVVYVPMQGEGLWRVRTE
jgi:hypothetical protein